MRFNKLFTFLWAFEHILFTFYHYTMVIGGWITSRPFPFLLFWLQPGSWIMTAPGPPLPEIFLPIR